MKLFPSCGWHGSIRDFLDVPEHDWIACLIEHHERCMLEPPSPSQQNAWNSSGRTLKKCLGLLVEEQPSIAHFGLVFEYELPRERGRRPDAILLSNKEVIVLEFKDTRVHTRSYIDQVAAYARDLLHYHAASHHLTVKPVLVLTQASHSALNIDNVDIVSGDALPAFLRDSLDTSAQAPDLAGWIASNYEPLPDIVSAARDLFNHQPLPHIRRVQNAGIPRTLSSLTDIAEKARSRGERHLVVLTGVPGSGKTLAGLQLAYSDSTGNREIRNNTVFLSGNGPLVTVLQHALNNKVFVQDVHGFLKQYGGNQILTPPERVWIYDEAQRAWDANKSREKRGNRISQPEDFLRIASRIDDWICIVLLIGEGQEIHVGEEAGLEQWNNAINETGNRWFVHCPPRLGGTFLSADNVVSHPELDLTTSLRSHLAEDVHVWVASLLDGDLKTAGIMAERIQNQGFMMFLTRDLEYAKDYVRTRYKGYSDKRYGLLASSKAVDLEYYGIKNHYYSTRNVKFGPWYNNDPDDKASCCGLEEVVTEFGCQGLELDFPIVCWGSDMKWDRNAWRTPITRRINAVNPRNLRLNSYRVLLTRGRDGFVIFVPPARRYDITVEALIKAGITELST